MSFIVEGLTGPATDLDGFAAEIRLLKDLAEHLALSPGVGFKVRYFPLRIEDETRASGTAAADRNHDSAHDEEGHAEESAGGDVSLTLLRLAHRIGHSGATTEHAR